MRWSGGPSVYGSLDTFLASVVHRPAFGNVTDTMMRSHEIAAVLAERALAAVA